jgi:DNA polymerase III delta prime subunit
MFPPPHTLFFEPLNDLATRSLWEEYTSLHTDMEVLTLDAAQVFSVEDFGKVFESWVTTRTNKRIKLLCVLHAHCLTLACQQSLRRWMETKSYKYRIWFHVEQMNTIQQAIQSRCILNVVSPRTNTTPKFHIIGEGNRVRTLWKSIQSDRDLEQK